MATVRLDFVPPSQAGMVALRIEESSAQDGSFAEIERATAIGAYPNYISDYTTNLAVRENDWFRIRWEDENGAFSPYSGAIQGGTKTLVQEIVDRTLLRNPSLNEIIVTQEAQAAIASYYNTNDPNSILVTDATQVEMRGLTNMTLARSLVATTLATGGSVSGFTAGLVSIKSGATSTDPTKAIEALIKAANDDLGGNYSIILLMSEWPDGNPLCGCAPAELVGVDLTRTVIDYEAEVVISP